MNVLHVAAITRDETTGPGASVPLQMAAELQAGHRVGFLQTHPGAPAVVPPDVVRLAWRPARVRGLPRPFPARALFAAVGFRPDVVHFHSVYLTQHAAIAAAVRRLGIPTVNSPRGGLMPAALATHRVRKRVGDALFFDRFCRGLVLHRALTDAERVACLTRYPMVPAAVAGNPIDVDAVPVAPARPIRRGTLVLGFVGRLEVWYKGLDLLLSGLARAVGRGLPDGVTLRIAGPDTRGGAATLRRLVADLALGTRVTLGGPVTGADKAGFLAGVDLFVQPSRTEALPMAVLEAMASARPVLVTPATNVGPLVERHGAGWVVPGNADALAGRLVAIARGPEELRARGVAAREAVRRECSPAAIGAALTDAYGSVLERAAARGAA